MDNLDETKLNEAILRLFYDMPFIGMAITSPKTKRWVKFNDRLCEILGYSREELPQITWTEITHPDDLELDVAEFERVMRGETEGYVMDKRFIRKDGCVIDASIDVKCIRRKDRTIDFFVATVQDISDRKLAEAKQKQAEKALQELNEQLESRVRQRTLELQASETRFGRFFDFAPIGIAVANVANYRFESVNQAFCQLLGYSEVELLDFVSCMTISTSEDWELERPYAEAMMKGETNFYQIEKRYIKKDGTIIIGSLTTTTLRDQDGNITHLIGMVQDISDRKLAEKLLLKSDTHLKTAQRIGKLGSWEFELSTGKITWSDEVFRVYGLEPSANPPDYEQLQLYVHPEDWRHFDQTVQSAIDLKESYDLEHRIIHPNGKLIYVMAKGEMIYNISGQLTHIIGTVMDITDRKLAETKILHTANQLANTNRELESFSYSVSHDLRAPLRHMNGFVNALQQRLKTHEALSDPKVDHYLQVIEKSSQKMGHLIDGLLTLSRYGRRPLESNQISIRDLVDEAIEIIRTDPSHNPLVKFAIGNLPTTVGDRILLQQVFQNLIGNAVKFSRNQPQPYIKIDSLPDQTIRISDNGVGFQMEYADKLFGAFQRLHNDKEFEGTGIGLAIVQRIVQRHGGSIWAEGYPDQGATFFIKLRTYAKVPRTKVLG